LHFLLELDLLLSLIIGILGSQFFELLRIGLLIFRTLVLEMLFNLLVLLKEVLDLVLVSLKDLTALVVEGFLNVV
jgi:hypothetical protein